MQNQKEIDIDGIKINVIVEYLSSPLISISDELYSLYFPEF